MEILVKRGWRIARTSLVCKSDFAANRVLKYSIKAGDSGFLQKIPGESWFRISLLARFTLPFCRCHNPLLPPSRQGCLRFLVVVVKLIL